MKNVFANLFSVKGLDVVSSLKVSLSSMINPRRFSLELLCNALSLNIIVDLLS